jgi:hypothetical protein
MLFLGNVKFPNETLRLYFYRRRIIGFNDGLQNGAIRSFTDKSILLLDENTKKTTELGVSGKLTIHFGNNLFQKNGFGFVCQ